MKKTILLMAVAAIFAACQVNKDKQQTTDISVADNSRTSLDWAGTYFGTLPCADCSGIDFMLILNTDDTYVLRRAYLSDKAEGDILTEGAFTWDDKGSVITLNADNKEEQFQLKVGENNLLYLDQEGKVITGNLADKYNLKKLDTSFVGKKFKLIELMGQPVTTQDGMKEAFISFDANGRAHGNLGCNSFTSAYILKSGNRISFSHPASTMMMCLNMETETKMTEVLTMADNYNYVDGTQFILNRARMAPLARFELVAE
ncbi:copper resistance protein NlpE N-terminal domain-containing protein [Bacteroidales bacterium OttesenSCG-928-L03]|nr:copper resistance protein NlpE N-terminal domain-containing protein [Bacteroidales bacterium OttesenSCG-928-L03]